jgi:hypothetical protein
MPDAGERERHPNRFPAPRILHLASSTKMNTDKHSLKTYIIRVGHWEVRLKAHDREEAIALARRQMARELPRLYDVIRSLTANRFQVEPAA